MEDVIVEIDVESKDLTYRDLLPLFLTHCFCGLDSRGMNYTLLAGSLGLRP